MDIGQNEGLKALWWQKCIFIKKMPYKETGSVLELVTGTGNRITENREKGGNLYVNVTETGDTVPEWSVR